MEWSIFDSGVFLSGVDLLELYLIAISDKFFQEILILRSNNQPRESPVDSFSLCATK